MDYMQEKIGIIKKIDPFIACIYREKKCSNELGYAENFVGHDIDFEQYPEEHA